MGADNPAPIVNAWASPSGDGCEANVIETPNRDPSPNSRSKPSASCGVVITRMSRIPANISVDNG